MTDETPDVSADELAARDYLTETEVEVLLANQLYVLFQAGSARLNLDPPDTESVSALIDAIRGVLDAAGTHLGENLALYREALAELQLAYVRALEI